MASSGPVCFWELLASRLFSPEELGRSGVDQLPNPLSMPASLRATFDTRQVGLW